MALRTHRDETTLLVGEAAEPGTREDLSALTALWVGIHGK